MEEKNTCIEKLLQDAIEFNKSHCVTPLEQGNLFTILDMERKEVSAHSAFLQFVFKPFRNDDSNLRELLKALLKARESKYGTAYKDVEEYMHLDIRREVWFKNSRMDFVIDADDETFVIELKIDAEEQPEQITRYQKYTVKRGSDENNVFFLTPSPRAAITGKAANITLEKEIYEVFERICEKRKSSLKYVGMIRQYMELIDKITGKKKDMSNVIKSIDGLKAVETLVEERNCKLQKLMIDFFTKIKEKLGETINVNTDADKSNSAKFPIAKEYTNYAFANNSINKYYFDEKMRYPALVFKIDKAGIENITLNEGVDLYYFIEADLTNSKGLYCGISPRKATKNELENINNIGEAFSEQTIDKLEYKHLFVSKYGEGKLYLTNGDAKVINFCRSDLKNETSFLLFFNDDFSVKENEIDNLCNKITGYYKKQCKDIFDLNIQEDTE